MNQAFDCVTVLFLDIMIVDAISAGTPFDAVRCMNVIFSCLDNVLDRHPVYKVETVGQVYMLVGGAPEKSLTHVRDVALVSLDFQNELDKAAAAIGMNERIRIGKHCETPTFFP